MAVRCWNSVAASHKRFIRSTPSQLVPAAAESEVKTKRDCSFYESWGTGKRVYFYQVDLRGRLFLDSPNLLRRNDATCLKSKEFLDFFFKRVKRCPIVPEHIEELKNPNWREALSLFSQEYPWMSPCGKELNLLKADDTPIVFKDLIKQSHAEFLLYGGSLLEPFDPARIFVGAETERIYYRRENREHCLIHADLAQRLSKGFAPDASGWWEWNSIRYELPIIPSSSSDIFIKNVHI